jgi:protein-tyrosine kinase
VAKTFEALTRFEKESGKDSRRSSLKTPKTEARSFRTPVLDSRALRSYQDLRTNLLTRYKDKPIKSILFVGTAQGDGASTTAINFATMLADDYRLKVLFLDFTGKTGDNMQVLKPDSVDPGTDDYAASPIDPKMIGLGDPALPAKVSSDSMLGRLVDSEGFAGFLKKACEGFNYIIMVAPPVLGSMEARAVCANVDGVVMVLASGKTRRQTALKTKETLEKAGGKIVGVVLNKRKYYIPEWVYRRL